MINQQTHHRGFTLIEVMIALLIIGIALVAIVEAVGKNTRDVAAIQQRVMADWVGRDVIAGMQAGILPASDKSTGTEHMLHKTWYWQLETQANKTDPYVVRLNVQVTNTNGGKPLETVTGFLRTHP